MGETLVVAGTQKGVFVLRSGNGGTGSGDGNSGGSRAGATGGAGGASFELSGPHLGGEEVYSVAIDQRAGRCRLLAGATSPHWGTVLRWSDDLGQTWSDPERGNIKFPADTGAALNHIWLIHPAG